MLCLVQYSFCTPGCSVPLPPQQNVKLSGIKCCESQLFKFQNRGQRVDPLAGETVRYKFKPLRSSCWTQFGRGLDRPRGRRAYSTRFPEIGEDSRAWSKGHKLKVDTIKGIQQQRTASTHALLGQAACDDSEGQLVVSQLSGELDTKLRMFMKVQSSSIKVQKELTKSVCHGFGPGKYKQN
jgi:hypothetical protein